LKKIKSIIILTVICLSCTLSVNAGPQLRWHSQLENGMDIFIIEDHSSPLVASVINTRAGSHTETLQINGLSHLLEHLLFDGTPDHTAAQIKQEIEARGGYNNAFTRKDFVSFEIVMPTDSFLYGLEIQADQLLHSNFPEVEFIREKKVVCEEIATDIRSSSSAADDVLWETLFGPSGYGLPVIGNYQTVTDVSLERVANFYHARYVPNRMTAIVIGDVNPQPVLDKFRELYGTTNCGLENPGPGALPEFPAEGVRKVVQKPIKSRSVSMAFPAPSPDDPAFRPFQAAVTLWADSSDSDFQKAVTSFATRTGAYVSSHKGFSILQIIATPIEAKVVDSDKYVGDFEEAVLSSIKTFLERELTQEEVDRYIQSARVDHEFAREKFHHLARELGEYAALGGLEHYWDFDQEINELTPETLSSVFSMWIGDIRPVVIMVEPGEEISDKGTELDRPVIKTLSNGLTVITHFDSYTDMVALHMLTPNPGSEIEGIPRIVAEMLDSGTEEMTGRELEIALQDRGIRTKLADLPWLPFDDYYDSTEYNYFRMESLSEDIDTSMNLMAQMLFKSTLPDDAWEKLAPSMNMVAGRTSQSSSSIARSALRDAIYKDTYHRQARLPQSADIHKITPEILRQYYTEAYNPAACILSVVGNIQPDDLFEMAEKYFGNLSAKPFVKAPLPQFNEPRRVFTAVESDMAYIRAAIQVDASPQTIPVWSLAADVLSEALQEEIRAKRGKAYRLGAWLDEKQGCTFLEIGIGTRSENLEEIEAVAREIVTGISDMTMEKELVEKTKTNLIGHELRYRQRRINRAYYLAWRYWLGLGIDFEYGYTEKLKAISTRDVNNLLKTLKPSEQWFWSIAASEDKE